MPIFSVVSTPGGKSPAAGTPGSGKKKRKRDPKMDFKGFQCICDDPAGCADLMERLDYINIKCGWCALTKVQEEVTFKRDQRDDRRDQLMRKRELTLKHLQTTEGRLAKRNNTTQRYPKFSSLHVKPELVDLAKQHDRGCAWMPEFISYEVAMQIGLTENDRVDKTSSKGNYFGVPNQPRKEALRIVEKFEREAAIIGSPPLSTSTSPTLTSFASPPLSAARDSRGLRQAKQLVDTNPDGAAHKIENLETELAKVMQQLSRERQEKELAETRIKALETQAPVPVDKRIQLRLECAGLSRFTLTSDAWHKQHPEAARHLFGFRTWTETVNMVLALFMAEGARNPMKEPLIVGGVASGGTKGPAMRPVEKCLVAKMRIHRGYTQKTLALMWGRSERQIGSYLKEWIPHWGEAGEDLSILDITEDFLDATYPQAYKDAGMLKIVALPDGKDFMINDIRSNTLLTRASFSDKVHHAAVRCISWSTPTGLMFEHTDLFFARVSEKKLVSLWGPRLKKCPPGWRMLSDRGFAGTASYYPNFNAQLTPAFLKGRDRKTGGEVVSDHEICKLRYTCEVAFSRVTVEASLQDVIPYWFIPSLDALNHWGHAHANLYNPLQT